MQLRKFQNKAIIALVLVFIAAVGFIGWTTGKASSDTVATPQSINKIVYENSAASSQNVESLVSLKLPTGWTKGICEADTDILVIMPSSTTVDCSNDTKSRIEAVVDTNNTTDCQQLQNMQDVRKHVCISLYIDGHKSLKSSTEYLQSSTYGANTTVSAYYINTDNGVVKLAYTYNGDNTYQADFDRLATNSTVK